ncbi:MAG: hypothetical protein KatS3mg096_730 [Candidatus Parcubacteria bacterium]|nr:MAG: hypothetical protein KatS3mg096_730 [Candidatus Parcubacteria bacterium]
MFSFSNPICEICRHKMLYVRSKQEGFLHTFYCSYCGKFEILSRDLLKTKGKSKMTNQEELIEERELEEEDIEDIPEEDIFDEEIEEEID